MEWVTAPVAIAAGWVLTLTFAWAVAAKFVRGDAWPAAVTRFGFTGAPAQAIVFAVPLAEIAAVVLFIVGAVRPAAALTLALMASFSAAIVRARALRGRRVPCGCFGKTRERDYRLLLARNGVLALAAALVLFGPEDLSLRLPDGSVVMPIALAITGTVVLGWAAIQTMSSLRRR